MEMRFFTSDHHFWHANIIKYCKRPFATAEEMNEAMVRAWNNTVKPEDTVYYLGDFSMAFRSVELYTKRLNGTKHLILGNHDFAHPAHKKGQKEPELWRAKYLENGFESVQLETKLIINGETVLLHHMPYVLDHSADIRYSEYRPVNTGLFLLCGHIHEKWLKRDKQINVGVDRHNFTPVSEERIVELMKVEGDIV